MQEGQIFENIDELIIDGVHDILIDENGNIIGVKEFKQNGSRLVLNGSSTNSMVVRNGILVMTFHNGTTINTFSGQGIVYVNGKRIDLSQIPEAKEEPDKVCRLGNNCLLTDISLSGTGSLSQIPSVYLSDRLSIVISGSANLILPPKTFKMLQCQISGQGGIDGSSGTQTKHIMVSLSGMGNVEGLHVLQDGNITVSGMGHVSVTAKDKKRVKKTVSGMGSVSIK